MGNVRGLVAAGLVLAAASGCNGARGGLDGLVATGFPVAGGRSLPPAGSPGVAAPPTGPDPLSPSGLSPSGSTPGAAPVAGSPVAVSPATGAATSAPNPAPPPPAIPAGLLARDSAGTLTSRLASFVPAGDPVTWEKATLGKAIFWDVQLGADRTQACATCHSRAGADPRSLAVDASGALAPVLSSVAPASGGNLPDLTPGRSLLDGDVVGSIGVARASVRQLTLGVGGEVLDFAVAPDPAAVDSSVRQVTRRQAPPAVNAAFNRLAFWDGRASAVFLDLAGNVVLPGQAALESQAVGPPLSPVEMGCAGESWDLLAARLANPATVVLGLQRGLGSDVTAVSLLGGLGAATTYRDLFAAAFGDPAVTRERIAMAIATYERLLVSDATPYDRSLAGDPGALSADARAGLDLFRGKARCDHCHVEPWLTDAVVGSGETEAEGNTAGFHFLGVRPAGEDPGRFKISGAPADWGAMKTAQLRNVKLTAPYFHNGRKTTLEEVVDFYDRGGDFANGSIQPLGLSAAEKASLVVFLRDGLTDPAVEAERPPFDHPRLP